MPRINIYEQDNTGSSPVADLAVVFVPGVAEIKAGKADANGCVYIPSTTTDLSAFFAEAAYSYEKSGASIDVRHMVKMLIDQGYGVIYKQVAEKEVYKLVGQVSNETFQAGTFYTYDVSEALYKQAEEYDSEAAYYVKVKAPDFTNLNEDSWSFLNDKNAYDVKFITTGVSKTIPVFEQGEAGWSGNQETEKYAFNFATANALLDPITNRKDCILIADLDYDAVRVGLNANQLAKDFKTALEYPKAGEEAEGEWRLIKVRGSDGACMSSRATTMFTNCEMIYSDADGDHVLSVPGSLVYLYAYAVTNNRNTNWLPISGVNRGVVGDLFTPDIELSKFYLDNEIITDAAGVSFNAVVNIRSYGYTIWGDRTLLQQDKVRKVQATSYVSLRNLVSDIAKVAYRSAIRYTYETNNDVTWLNFKQQIITLLDQMVSSGVLQTYKVGRKASSDEERNKMIAVIKIMPLLPVENFDVYINLENAEISTPADEQ